MSQCSQRINVADIMSEYTGIQETMIRKWEIWVKGFSEEAVPGDDNIPWEQSRVWSRIRLPVIEVRRTRDREPGMSGLSTWTNRSSRKMAGLGVKMKNVRRIKDSLYLWKRVVKLNDLTLPGQRIFTQWGENDTLEQSWEFPPLHIMCRQVPKPSAEKG